MKMLKYILFLLAGLVCLACNEDEGNPPFAADELYIYDQTAESLTAVVGQEFKLSLIVSPNDGSVECTWLLDEQAIGPFERPGLYVLPAGDLRPAFRGRSRLAGHLDALYALRNGSQLTFCVPMSGNPDVGTFFNSWKR